MDVTEMSTRDFLVNALAAAEDCKYPALAVLIARTADADAFQSRILEDWASLDDVTSDQILVVTPANTRRIHLQAVVERPTADYQAITSPAILVRGQSPRFDGAFWKEALRHPLAPPERLEWKAALTRSATETLRFFGLSESMAPCLVLLALQERQILVFEVRGTTNLYELLRGIIIEYERERSQGGSSFSAAALTAAKRQDFTEKRSETRRLEGDDWRLTSLREGWADEPQLDNQLV